MIVATTTKWIPVEIDTVLRLLKPVEYQWKKLALLLLKEGLIYNVNTIESTSFHNNAPKEALDEVLKEWHTNTKTAVRTWQTLCNIAKKYGDVSLEQYMQKMALKVSFSI